MSLRHLPAPLQGLRLPVIASPLFIASTPALVVAQCTAGIVGAFPALNARPADLLDSWLGEINEALAAFRRAHPGAPVGPIAVNHIVHPSNTRFEQDTAVLIKHRVPIIISTLRAPPKEVLDEVHAYGGIVMHDVISIRHARKALEEGVDGLILVAAGAGGHAGTTSPFALVGEVRKFFAGPLALAGAISTGEAVLAAQVMGADFAYIGSRWLAASEANVNEAYRQAILASAAADIVYTNAFSGVHGNYLKASILRAGLDPDKLPQSDKSALNFGAGGNTAAKAWRDIWGAGQGVGLIDGIDGVAQIVDTLEQEYLAARQGVQHRIQPLQPQY